MDPDQEQDLADWLRSVGDASERARFLRVFGGPQGSDVELIALEQHLAALRPGGDGALLAAIMDERRQTKVQKRAEKKAERRLERARMNPRLAKGFGGPFAETHRTRVQPPTATNCVEEAVGDDHARHTPAEESDSMGEQAQGQATSSSKPETKPAPRVMIPEAYAQGAPPPGSLVEGISLNWYLSPEKFWPHIKHSKRNLPDLPDWVRAREAEWRRWRKPDQSKNPFRQAPRRSADLTRAEFFKVYRAMSFALDQEILMTMHIVILWRSFGVTDDRKADRLSGKVLEHSSKWAAVGKPDINRQRHRQRSGYGTDLAWVRVHESGHGRGFHTHILCNIPVRYAKDFTVALQGWLKKLTGCCGDSRAVRVIVAGAKDEQQMVVNHWRWMRYVTKGLPDGEVLQYRGEPIVGSLREVMKIWRYREGAPAVGCESMARVSHNLGASAQKQAGFISKLEGDRTALASLYDGSELRDGRLQRENDATLKTLSI